jgi:hypothetical protein
MNDTRSAAERLTPGTKLWFVGSRNSRTEREVTVLSVGRKWAKLDNHTRIDIETMWADGGQYSSPGRAFRSKQEYDANVMLDRLWSDFRHHVADFYGKPDGITEGRIRAAAAALGIELTKEAT